ncbi:hypothetical protein Pmani_038246, partial [Petrolisthes manimaculis]
LVDCYFTHSLARSPHKRGESVGQVTALHTHARPSSHGVRCLLKPQEEEQGEEEEQII